MWSVFTFVFFSHRDLHRPVNQDGRPGWDSKPLPVDDETHSIVSQVLRDNQQVVSDSDQILAACLRCRYGVFTMAGRFAVYWRL